MRTVIGSLMGAALLLLASHADARYYDPKDGRFLQEDAENTATMILRRQNAATRDPQQLNLYPYVENNPVNLVDPLGLFPAEQLLRAPIPLTGSTLGWNSATPLGPVTPLNSTDGTMCSVAAEGAREVQCQLVDQSETICQYQCSDGTFKVLNKRQVGGTCPPTILYQYP